MQQTRRAFLKTTGGMLALAGGSVMTAQRVRAARKPNVILIMTDDQGYGDVGVHGNTAIQTPHMDRIHNEGVHFDYFYVCPVCSPTRACLMTGRYNYRTRAIDTYLGRSMMDPDEVTVAEALRGAGYHTGIFGKWHLGDNYPMRTIDQGFEESLVHRGGGMCQPSDWPGNTYFDPTLSHNGQDEAYKGYCTDVFTDGALAFIEANRGAPFFCYLATNAPHDPLQVPEAYEQRYADADLDERTKKVYGMITNIDDNIGRVLAKLDELGIADDTIVIFLTDNGPAIGRRSAKYRYNAGLRAGKGSVYEGGIRVPCFIRWPGHFEAGAAVDRIAAHIDLMPTILDLCGAAPPKGVKLDGRSLAPLLEGDAAGWPDRALFFQWHRGDAPEPFRACAVRTQRYKLVDGKELYDLEADNGEQKNIAGEDPERVAALRAAYEAWFKDVSSSRGYAPPRIYVGTPHENPVVLTRQDWRAADGWGPKALGYWLIKVTQPGPYRIDVRLEKPLDAAATLHLACGGVTRTQALAKGAAGGAFEDVPLPAGDQRLDAWIEQDGAKRGIWQADVAH